MSVVERMVYHGGSSLNHNHSSSTFTVLNNHAMEASFGIGHIYIWPIPRNYLKKHWFMVTHIWETLIWYRWQRENCIIIYVHVEYPCKSSDTHNKPLSNWPISARSPVDSMCRCIMRYPRRQKVPAHGQHGTAGYGDSRGSHPSNWVEMRCLIKYIRLYVCIRHTVWWELGRERYVER